MHAKTDSEVTSNAASSPTRSPRRAVYYVQSPSQDGEKSATSFHSTPVLRSPMDSPPHSSSSTRFSGSRKISPNEDPSSKAPWKHCDVIEEEGLLPDEDPSKPLPRRCYALAFLLGFFLLFSLFALILWGASRPMNPHVTMKTITFEQFRIQAGSDFTGVATDMATINSTVNLIFRNTGTFFGVHVSSTPLDLSFSQISVASGNVKNFYQSRKTQRSLSIHVIGDRIPLYGSGEHMSSSTGSPALPIQLKLTFVLRSRAYVLGQFVKPKFYTRVDCPLTFDPNKLNIAMRLKNCTVTS